MSDKKLKLGYFADGPWAHETFKKLLKDNEVEVVFLVPRFDTRDPVLVKIAEENSIPVCYFENVFVFLLN